MTTNRIDSFKVAGRRAGCIAGQGNRSILKHLSFGIAMHHAGMPESDRQIAEEAFSSRLVQVLIATSTVAWGVNFRLTW